MNPELRSFLERAKKLELKAMYSLSVDDPCFGCETELYNQIEAVLKGKSVDNLIQYLERCYNRCECEKEYIDRLKKIAEE